MSDAFDVTVVGSGPNGLAAAVTAARAGLRVRLLEAAATLGGGVRTAELTLPGFRHDVCSAVHPAALASPFFREFGLPDRVNWVIPDVSYAHPLDGGRAALAWRDLNRTADQLGRDGAAWKGLFEPLLRRLDGVVDFTGSQLLRWPRDPVAAFQYGVRSLEQGTRLLRNARFKTEEARALLAGASAHAAGQTPSLSTSGAGLLLATHAHAGGWGFPIGGSQAIADVLLQDFFAHGGVVETGQTIRTLRELPASKVTLLDTSVKLLLTGNLPAGYARALRRYRYGSGVAKVDFALAGPVPWANPDVAHAPTVHLGGTRDEIGAAENLVHRGGVPERPYVLVTQPSVLDPTRAPKGRHVLWAYTHVPAGSTLDATELITAQVERYAPGFRDLVLATASSSARQQAAYNRSNVGGDIYGGAVSLWQLVKRPVVSTKPWRTPLKGIYLCSAATPPGPAVHGMNGWHAARLALKEHFGIDVTAG